MAIQTNDVLFCTDASKKLRDCIHAIRGKRVKNTSEVIISKEECIAMRPFLPEDINQYTFSGCISDSALASGDEKTCNLLKDNPVKQANCIMNVAKSTKDESKCDVFKTLPPIKKPWDYFSFENCIKWASSYK